MTYLYFYYLLLLILNIVALKAKQKQNVFFFFFSRKNFLQVIKILYKQIQIYWAKTFIRYISQMYWFIYNGSVKSFMLFRCDSFIYRAVRSPLIKLLCCHYDKSHCFSIFLLRCSNVYCIHILFVVKLAFNFIRSWFVTLYFSGSHFSVTYQFYDFIHDLFLSFDINT